MRKLFVFMMMFCVVLSSNAQRKKANGGNADAAIMTAGVVGAVASAVYYEIQMREMVEQSAMEWALLNKEYSDGDKLEMKLIEWEVKAVTDISNTSNLLFKYRKNNEPYEVILFITSQGWWNSNGIVFSQVQPISVDKEMWSSILGKFISIACEDTAITLLGTDSLRFETTVKEWQGRGSEGRNVYYDVKYSSDYSMIEKIKGRKIRFNYNYKGKNIEYDAPLIKIKGDEHIVGKLNNGELVLDYNENRINLYNVSTRDLIKLNVSAVNEIHRLLFREPFWFDAI